MKKIFVLTVLIALILSNVCFAFTKVDFTLGGLTLNHNYNDVIKMYGEPTSKPGGWSQLVSNVIKYGNDVEIGFTGEKVRYIVTTANNGWKTFAGVYVGMNVEEVINLYGNDFTTETRTAPLNSAEKYFYYKWSGTKYSWAEVSHNYTYAPGDTLYIFSVVVNDGKVTAIELNKSTPEY